MKIVAVLLASLSFFVVLRAFAQEPAVAKYALQGVFRDQNSAVVPGLRLQIDGASSSLTDINGEFKILLSNGDHILTADVLPPDKFRAFIKIVEGNLNPGYLEFVVDSNALVCSGNRGGPSPKVITSSVPSYPAAARAVRAGGEVTVIVGITSDGKVSTAKAVSGHPLLKRVSEVAAEKFIFETTVGISEREAGLAFVFLPDQEAKDGVRRYECPYRILVHDTVVILNTVSVDPPSVRRTLLYRLKRFLRL